MTVTEHIVDGHDCFIRATFCKTIRCFFENSSAWAINLAGRIQISKINIIFIKIQVKFGREGFLIIFQEMSFADIHLLFIV